MSQCGRGIIQQEAFALLNLVDFNSQLDHYHYQYNYNHECNRGCYPNYNEERDITCQDLLVGCVLRLV